MTSGVSYFPIIVPANSVVGRLSSTAGITEAIPFAQLAVALGVGGSTYLLASNIGGTNTITGTTATAPALIANQVVFLIPANTNTGATTFDRDAQGTPKSIFCNGAALVGGEIQAGNPVILFYDGTRYHLLQEQAISDGQPLVVNAADATKKVKLNAAGLTTATTRTITVADRDFAIGKQPTRQTFTSGTGATYTTPAGATRIMVRLVGGGAGSGSAAATSGTQASSGGGGGGGSYAEKLFLAPAATYTYTVGGGGTAGNAGGQTSFSTVTAPGGTAGSNGVANNNTETGVAGGAGGVAGANGDLHVPGSDGGFGIEAQAAYAVGGPGGASALGFGGMTHNVRTVTNAAGVAGKLYGGGAAGAANSVSQGSTAGAAGAAGIVVVDEFYN